MLRRIRSIFARVGAIIKQGLEAMKGRFEMMKEVRGRGLMIAIAFDEPKSFTLKAGWKLVNLANKGLFGQMVVVPLMSEHRILSQVAGHSVNIVKILPPLIITEDDARYFVSAFERVMEDCHKFPGNAWKVGKDLAMNAARASRM